MLSLRKSARLFSSVVRNDLKILIVDGYSQKSRDDFAKGDSRGSLTLASDLYCMMLEEQALKTNASLSFDVVFPCESGYELLSPNELAAFDGACFTGSSYSAYDDVEDVHQQIKLMRALWDSGVSIFGSCWGLQVAAIALGGKVDLNAKGREVGVGRKIQLTPEGRDHPMFVGKKSCYEAFMSHGDEVTEVPPGGVVLSGNDHTRVQSMSVLVGGIESWFVQYHPEYNLDYFARLIGMRKERMVKLGFFSNRDDVDVYVEELCALHGDYSLKNLLWKYGIDDDLIDSDIKQMEVRNWIKYISK